MTKAEASRYLGAFFLSAMLVAVFCFALGVFADPYRMFGSERFLPSPPIKPRISQQGMLAKTYMVRRTPMNTVILGNSRVEIGIDPASRMWPAAARPVFNGGLAGHDLAGTLTLFRDVVMSQSPKFMILGVDFQDFIGPGQTLPASIATDINRTEPRTKIRTIIDSMTATMTLDAVADSVMTLMNQDARYGDTMQADGFNPQRSYRRENPTTLFNQKLAEYKRSYSRYRPSGFSAPAKNAEFLYLSAILNICDEHHIRCTLFIYPYHAEYLEMLHELGLWGSFESWKRALAGFVETNHPDVQLIDFSGYNEITTEPLPAPGASMKFYWEPGHFKAALGDLIVARLFYRTSNDVLLTSATVDADISAIRAQRQIFLHNHPAPESGR